MTADPEDRSVLLWHVHGSWTDAFVRGRHRYLLPVNEARDADGLGLAGRRWPRATEVKHAELAATAVDVVILQRPHELELVTELLGRVPGKDVPAVYVEHNAPRPFAVDSVHPLADQRDIPLIHVTDFNKLMWDNGIAETAVIAHGIVDPGYLYSGRVAAAATMINEPIRRNRVVGTDLLGALSGAAPIDVWGIGTDELNHPDHQVPGVTGRGDTPHDDLMAAVAARRVYLHTARWTSLGLSLIEAMYLGMPVVCVGSTMAPLVVPGEAGVVSADIATLGNALTGFVTDLAAATLAGKAAREFAMAHFSLERFLDEWEAVIDALCERKGAQP
jgi:glycosyltransferase involved in cell wall biosynthesis